MPPICAPRGVGEAAQPGLEDLSWSHSHVGASVLAPSWGTQFLIYMAFLWQGTEAFLHGAWIPRGKVGGAARPLEGLGLEAPEHQSLSWSTQVPQPAGVNERLHLLMGDGQSHCNRYRPKGVGPLGGQFLQFAPWRVSQARTI